MSPRSANWASPTIMKQWGLEIGGGTPEAFQAVIQTEVERIQKLINSGALTAQ